MSKSKNKNTMEQIPNIAAPLQAVLRSDEELKYGLRGVVRILGGRGTNGRNGYFFEGFKTVFASEIGERIDHEEVFLDYENLKIIIKLPDPSDPTMREAIRHQITKDYTMGADDLKTRAALVAFEGLSDETKRALIEKEKAIEHEG